MKTLMIWLNMILLLSTVHAQEQDSYSFDMEEFTKKTWEWKGELSLAGISRILNPETALYPVKFEGTPENAQTGELKLVLESRWDWEWSRLYLIGEAWHAESSQEELTQERVFWRESYWEWAQAEPHRVTLGKQLIRWGTGYAFNPVAFLERPKSPDDPEAQREGLWLSQIILMTGAMAVGMQNSSLTLIYLPVRSDLNEDYVSVLSQDNRETENHENIWGIKFYALIGATDLDLYWVNREQQQQQGWGIDFASNITSSLEWHGEYAHLQQPDQTGEKSLLGLRYLTEQDVTWIVEMYHNSSGMTFQESVAQYQMIHKNNSLPQNQTSFSQSLLPSANRNYGYLKASIKEPFNWLYFNPSFALLNNLDDHSRILIIQAIYTPGTNWTHSLSGQWQPGGRLSQYGENPVSSE
ncbi:MAG: hypothetical protein HQM12_14300, partial [SAR324 cluster bacterium]|nr:hypothetical protein [SAR324 cluster bacterium]